MIKHSLANYPQKFLGCVVSPTKICLQFEEVLVKLRLKQGADYIKLPDTSRALPIAHTGTGVDITAVGCQMPVLEDLQANLIKAYVTYGQLHTATYEQQYGKDFMSFLLQTRKNLDDAITALTNGDRTDAN